MVDYFRYTGDRAFATSMRPVVRRQLDWIRSLTDGRGLLVTGPDQGGVPGRPLCCGLDWDPYGGQKTGAVSAYNIIFYRSLTEADRLERELGNRIRPRGPRTAWPLVGPRGPVTREVHASWRGLGRVRSRP